jgi:hypothetical protein
LPANSDYIQIRQPVYTSHSAGRYAAKRFRKAQCPIIERLTNSIMMNGRNNGKKAMAVRIVAHAFEIVRFHPHAYNPHWRHLLRRIGQSFNFRPDITTGITSSMICI